MKKKSLIGWTYNNWDLYFAGGYIKHTSITKFPICIPGFNKQVKVCISIKEIKR